MTTDITSSGLADRLAATADTARVNGALGPIETRAESITDAGTAYTLRTIANLAHKKAATAPATASADPFTRGPEDS